MTFQPPVRDHTFLLRDVLEIENYSNLPGFAEAPEWIASAAPWVRPGYMQNAMLAAVDISE